MIIKLKYGNTNTYFVHGINGGLLIDTDYAGTMQAFYKALKKSGISITDITYILATHYHPDHIGLVSELQKVGIKLLLIDTQCSYVHFADAIFKQEKHPGKAGSSGSAEGEIRVCGQCDPRAANAGKRRARPCKGTDWRRKRRTEA